MMRDELIKHMKDCSTKDGFSFKFLCSCCGTWWHSKWIPFSHSGIAPENESTKVIYDALYKREWNKQRKAVLDDAINHFSICPICHGLICDPCFLICDEIEMCISCAKRLNQSGKPVIAEASKE
ncbi:MAG: hypothetical protein ACI4VF_09410 [Lachnospirales bacterium]